MPNLVWVPSSGGRPTPGTVPSINENFDALSGVADLLDSGKADKSITLSAGTGLTGGGDLSANRSFALNASSIASLLLADTSLQPGDIGTTVQAYSAVLSAYAGGDTPSAFTLGIVDSADDAAWRTALSVYSTTQVDSAIAALAAVYQPLDSDLTAIAALSTSSFGRSVLTWADAAAGRTALSVYSASQVDSAISALSSAYQPLDSDLTAIAALTTTTYGRDFLTLADNAALATKIAAMAATWSGIHNWGSSSPQSAARIGFRGRSVAVEWGHGNTAGYWNTLGFNASNGRGFLAFNASAGTTSNTFQTNGIVGRIIQPDLAGGLSFGRAANASADDQALTVDFHLGPAGQFGIGGATYGTANTQAIVSGGASAPPSWQTVLVDGQTQTLGGAKTWTGAHTFNIGLNITGAIASGGASRLLAEFSGNASRLMSMGPDTSSVGGFELISRSSDFSVAKYALEVVVSAGAITTQNYGNTTDWPSHTFAGNLSAAGHAGGYVQLVSSTTEAYLYLHYGSSHGIYLSNYPGGGGGYLYQGNYVKRWASSGGAVSSVTYGNATDLPTHGFYGKIVDAADATKPYVRIESGGEAAGGRITISTSDPSGTPEDGDIWIKREA